MNILFQVLGRISIKDDTGLALIVGLCLVLSASIFFYIIWYSWLYLKAKSWSRIQGTIVKYEEVSDWHGSEAPKIKIRYSYSINGKFLQGTRFHLGWHRDRPSIAAVQLLRTNYESNKTVQVYVDLKDNRQSSLDISFDTAGIFFLFFLFFLGFFTVFIFINIS